MELVEKHIFHDKNFKGRSFSLIVILTFFVTMSFCQQPPNFSGDWVLNLNKSKLRADWTSGLTNGIIKIVHNEPNFSFWRSFTINGKDEVKSYEMLTNGQEQKDKYNFIWTLSWKQDTLLFIIQNHETISDVRYYHSENKKEFVADEKYDSPNMSYHNLWILEKKSLKTTKE